MRFELAVRIRCPSGKHCFEGCAFLRREIVEAVAESRVQPNDDIDIALRIDVRVVPVRTLQEYFEIAA